MKLPWIATGVVAALLLSAHVQAACPSPSADQTVALPGHPFAAEPSPDNCHLFVSLFSGYDKGALAVLSNVGGTFRITRIVKLPRGSGGGLTLTHNATLLALAAEDAVILFNVAKLDTPDQQPLVALIPDGGRGAIYTQFSKDDALLFASEERNASLAVIDVRSALQGRGDQALVNRIPVGVAPVGLALSADGRYLFSTSQIVGTSEDCKPEQDIERRHGKGAVLSIEVAKARNEPSRAVVGLVQAGCNPVRVVTSSDGHFLWVSQRGDGRVMGFDPALLAPGAAASHAISIDVGLSPVGLALRPDGAQLWVANSDRFGASGSSLALVEPANPMHARLTGTWKVGRFPRDLRFLPDGRTLVIALFGDNAVMLHPT